MTVPLIEFQAYGTSAYSEPDDNESGRSYHSPSMIRIIGALHGGDVTYYQYNWPTLERLSRVPGQCTRGTFRKNWVHVMPTKAISKVKCRRLVMDQFEEFQIEQREDYEVDKAEMLTMLTDEELDQEIKWRAEQQLLLDGGQKTSARYDRVIQLHTPEQSDG